MSLGLLGSEGVKKHKRNLWQGAEGCGKEQSSKVMKSRLIKHIAQAMYVHVNLQVEYTVHELMRARGFFYISLSLSKVNEEFPFSVFLVNIEKLMSRGSVFLIRIRDNSNFN